MNTENIARMVAQLFDRLLQIILWVYFRLKPYIKYMLRWVFFGARNYFKSIIRNQISIWIL